jgi:hypothetical protein
MWSPQIGVLGLREIQPTFLRLLGRHLASPKRFTTTILRRTQSLSESETRSFGKTLDDAYGVAVMIKHLKPEPIIMAVLNEIGTSFPNRTVQHLTELIDHNETGIALEVLCNQIFECGLDLSQLHKSSLKEAARLMNIPLLQLEGLADA